jgi:hypothetical protein
MATMMQALMALDDGALGELFRLRPDLAEPLPAGFAELADRASQARSVQVVCAGLDQFSGVVLQACCVVDDGAGPEAVVALLGGPGRCPPEALDAVLAGLAARALLWRGGGGAIHPALAVHAALGYPLGLGRPLAALATKSQVTVADLEGALVRLGLPGKQPAERKSDLIARLGAALADPVLVNGVVAAAPAAARELAYRLAGGRPTLPVQRAYGRSTGSPSDWLSERLLVVSIDWYQAEMPREVGLALRGGEAGLVDVAATRPEVVSSRRDPAVVSAAALAGAAEAVRITEAILETWSAAPPAALKAGGIGVRDLKRAALASGSAEGDVGVYVEVAAAAGLLRQAGDRFLPTSDYDGWRDGEPAQRWLRLATGWLAAGRLPSLAGERDDDDKPIAALNPKFAVRGAALVRAATLGALADDPASAPEPKALAAALLWDGPARWNSFPLSPLAAVDMILREAALLGVVGDGAPSPWGLELVAGRYAAALTAAGALGRNETAVTLQADLTAVAAGPVSADLGAELGLLADVESRGAATVWRFSDRSIGRAFDAGRTVEDILGFLAAHAGKGVPQTLEYLVGDVARRHGTIRAGTVAAYVRADDPALVAELCGAKKLRRCGLRRVAPTVAVATVDAAALVAALRAAGYLAVEEDGGGATVIRTPARRRAASTARPPTPLRAEPGGRRSGPAPAAATTPSPDDVGFWVVAGPLSLPADPAVDVPALVGALRAAGRGPTGPVRRDPRTGRIIGSGSPGSSVPGSSVPGSSVPGSSVPGSGVPGRRFPAEVSPFQGSPDDDLDAFGDLVEFDDDFDGDSDDDSDDDLGFDPDCGCPECVAAATRAVLGDDPVLLAQLSAMLEASPDDADERLALLGGARRDGRPLLIAYQHPRTGLATDVFRVLTVTGTTAHLRDSSGRERLVDVEWIEAIVETGGGPSGRRRRGRSRR